MTEAEVLDKLEQLDIAKEASAADDNVCDTTDNVDDRDEEEDHDGEESSVVQLGFAERVEPEERDETFCPESFPSKIGGQPTWLNPAKPLDASRALCGVCQEPMILLLQLYAPEDQPAEAFHRTIYVFCCSKGGCHQKSWQKCFRVVRSQLPEINECYEKAGDDADGDEGSDQEDDWDVDAEDLVEDGPQWTLTCQPAAQCVICGLHGSKRCSRCHSVAYCSRQHQILDWTVGMHREHCGKHLDDDNSDDVAERRARCVFDEREIVSEPEGAGDSAVASNAVELPHRLADTRIAEESAERDTEAVGEEYEDSDVHVDPAFLTFQRRVARYPEQVLRYARVEYSTRTAAPLWVSDKGMPTADDIPACEHCGTERTFEFQIMPQLLNFLRIDHAADDALDWGTLLVYTCAKNCHVADLSYVDERVWRQDFSRDGLQDRVAKTAASN